MATMAAAPAPAPTVVKTDQDPTGAEIDTDAFKQLYPRQFHERFFEAGLRPDGRTLGRARALTVGLHAVSSALGSCLVKLGSTTVLSGVRAQVGECPEGRPSEGTLKVNVELAPFALADAFPRGGGAGQGLAGELVAKLTQRLVSALKPLELERQLCIREGRGAYHAQLDVYVLDSDGSVIDAVLLSAIGAVRDTRLPLVKEDKDTGRVSEVLQGTPEAVGLTAKRLMPGYLPVAVTCAIVGPHLLVDPTREEEAVADSSVCVVLDNKGQLHGVYKAGGTVTATPMIFMKCIEAAKLRYKQVESQLVVALEAADGGQEQQDIAMQE